MVIFLFVRFAVAPCPELVSGARTWTAVLGTPTGSTCFQYMSHLLTCLLLSGGLCCDSDLNYRCRGRTASNSSLYNHQWHFDF